MTAGEARAALDRAFRKAVTPTAAALLDRYRREAAYDESAFPLAPAEFERFRARATELLLAALGDPRWRVREPGPRPSPVAELFETESLGRLDFQGVRLEPLTIGIRPTGDRVPAVLCLPTGAGRVPAVAVFSGHSDEGLRDLVLNADSYQRGLAVRLARAGFAALAVEKIDAGYLSRGFHAGAAGGDDEVPIATFLLAVGAPTVAARQVMASVSALEYLAGHPRVDPARIGAAGVSFGGWSAVYAAVLSDRAAAVADFGRKTQLIDFDPARFRGVEDYSHLFPGLAALGQRNLLPLVLAPRPLCLGHGRADAESDRQSFEAFRRPLAAQYRALGAERNLEYHVHPGGDVLPEAAVLGFFARVFAG